MLIRAVYATAGGTPCVFVQTETKSIALHLFHSFSPTLTVYITALSIFYATFPSCCSELQSSMGKEFGVGKCDKNFISRHAKNLLFHCEIFSGKYFGAKLRSQSGTFGSSIT